MKALPRSQLLWAALALASLVCTSGEDASPPGTSTQPLQVDREEIRRILDRLDAYYAGAEGLQRPEGLSHDGRPDFEGIAAWIVDVYLSSRIAGLSEEDSWRNVRASIEQSDEWRARHPGEQASSPARGVAPQPVLSRSEFQEVMNRLDAFYSSSMGLGRPQGLSIAGRPDFEGVAAWVFDVYLGARLDTRNPAEAWDAVIAQIETSEEFRGLHPGADRSTLRGKHLMGYQGWFGAPGDGTNEGWGHWFAGDATPATATFDGWPDTREYTPSELYPTRMTARDGTPATLFSSFNARTVTRHFRWMREAGIDGVSLGRFSAGTNGASRDRLDRIVQNVRGAAESQERVFFIWYDVTGHDPRVFAEELRRDWRHLIDDLAVTSSSAYLQHRGRPLVGVWGVGAGDRPGTPEEWQALVDFFKDNPDDRYRATLLMGGIASWRDDPTWSPVFRRADVVSPWAVGAFGDDAGADHYRDDVLEPDLAVCRALGIDYLPIAFPGFSWHNLQRGQSPVNAVPRRGGRFYWRQVHNIVAAGADILFTAMFDEVDEGTAMLKLAPSAAEVPVEGSWLTMDADGEALSSDFYLRLGGAAGKMLRGEIPLSVDPPQHP